MIVPTVKHRAQKVVNKVLTSKERSARLGIIEELFQDFNRNRVQVYKMNFTRGVFFGFGSVLGGTIVVGLLIWVMTVLVHIFPPLAHLFNDLITTMQGPAR